MAGSHGRGVDAFYVEGATPLHRIAAQIKIFAAFTFVLFVVLTPPNWFLAFALGNLIASAIDNHRILRRLQ
ncbi:MAG: hypothetical protein ACO3Q1_00535, partial [Candidatus Nanopelagicales bacterium]